ncbi:MAG: HAD family hydrolase [Desulfobacterales bacterium]|jgi:HAD superfamily hydrolase (TIGR01490 family)
MDGDVMSLPNPVAAFFDFDETLLEVESGRLGIQWLRDRRLLPYGYILKILVANFWYQRRLLSDERMVKILLTFYKNKRLAAFQNGSADFYREYLKPHLAPAIVARVKAHKTKGHFLVLISGSVRYLLEPVVEDMGFDHLLCTDLEVNPDGRLTGKAAGPVCVDKNKRKLTKELAQKIGLNLAKSYAYGNHHSDLALLESVGYPHAVAPNNILEKIARQRSWPILDYR